MNRRKALIVTGTTAAAGMAILVAERTLRDRGGPDRPAGVPVGPFGADSTAEEVTAGLDLSGKIALVTGVNSGLGAETLRVLTLHGAHVLGTARTLEKATAACAAAGDRATPFVLELTDFDSVVACAEAVRREGVALDMLVCNAGIMALPQLEQVNGLEKHFVTNHLGHFLLVNRLLDRVVAAPQGRVVVVSSRGYLWAPPEGIEFDNLSGERGEYDPNRAYGQSKLANGLFSLELARRLGGTHATSNSVHPGIIRTNLGRHFPRWKKTLSEVIGWTFMKSIPAGAATQCYVATNPRVAGVNGRYFINCNPEMPGGHMEDAALAAKLWAVSEELTRSWLGSVNAS
jgi:NAD(P)-dependent dehydrogenase (short-subunit alcohol dehydrogenase family)